MAQKDSDKYMKCIDTIKIATVKIQVEAVKSSVVEGPLWGELDGNCKLGGSSSTQIQLGLVVNLKYFTKVGT